MYGDPSKSANREMINLGWEIRSGAPVYLRRERSPHRSTALHTVEGWICTQTRSSLSHYDSVTRNSEEHCIRIRSLPATATITMDAIYYSSTPQSRTVACLLLETLYKTKRDLVYIIDVRSKERQMFTNPRLSKSQPEKKRERRKKCDDGGVATCGV